MAMLITVAHAQDEVLAHCRPGPPESVDVAEIDGRIAAATARARWDLPQRDVSVMDGYAVRSADVAHARSCGNAIILTVRGESAAGHPSRAPLEPGHAARISTGAVLPDGADAVIAQEDTDRDGDQLRVDDDALGSLDPGHFVRPRGRELREGDALIEPGQRLGPGDIALLAGSGHATVPVIRRPRVAILGTGDELVPAGQRPQPGQVVSSNGLVLAAMVRRAGAEPLVRPEVGDDPEATAAAIADGLSADVLITTGGISVGDHDLVHDQLRAQGVRIVFRGVALRPGKPTTFGVHGDQGARVFALPGNPASCLVAFALLVHPALRRIGGDQGDPHLPRRRVRLRGPARGAGRRAHYVRAVSHGPSEAAPLEVQQSGNLRSIAGADLLLPVPAGTDHVPAGAELSAIVLDPLAAPPTR